MLTELHGKGGNVCQLAKQGKIHCPLIVRPTSEDVITGNLVRTLRLLNPRWWLPDFLNAAVGDQRFRRQVFRKLEIKLWQNQPCYPREFLPWEEGSTQVDAIITWQNPPTTVYLELKYGSELSDSTARNDGSGRYPADQLIRNLRVGLWRTGWLRPTGLFPVQPRDFVLVLISPRCGNQLVREYRNITVLKKAIPHGALLEELPRNPFLGEIGYVEIVQILRRQHRWFSRPEQLAIDEIATYLDFKRSNLSKSLGQERGSLRQGNLNGFTTEH